MRERNLDRVVKVIRSEVKILDANEGRIQATMSTETKDRDGDIIRQEFWDTSNFIRGGGPLIDSHIYGGIEKVFGHWESTHIKGKTLVGEAVYHLNSPNPRVADLAKHGLDLAHRGMAAFSVGFLPDMSKAVELKGGDGFFPNFEFKGQELLEVSQVSVPANPDALQRMKGAHPVIDDLVDEMMGEGADRIKLALLARRTFTDDYDPTEEELAVRMEMLRGSPLHKRITITIDDDSIDTSGTSEDAMGAIEDRLASLETFLHTHPGGPDGEHPKAVNKSDHGEHSHEGNGSHNHDDDKTLDFAGAFKSGIEEAANHA